MVTFIVQDLILQAAENGDVKTLRDILVHTPDKVNVTGLVTNYSKVHLVVNIHTQ